MQFGGGSPFFSAVQTPFGPRKSATPALVDIPAPVLYHIVQIILLLVKLLRLTEQRSI